MKVKRKKETLWEATFSAAYFVGSFPSYGYIKDPINKSRLIIDELAADIVRKIFDWHVNEGLGKIANAVKLRKK